jgi:Mrp family chromosome partitioning ATPase
VITSADHRAITLLAPSDTERSASVHWRPLPAGVVSQLGGIAEALPRRISGARSLALLSPSRGEGTSTCVINLARALADRGLNVLVIDANVQNPALHSMLGANQAPGLAEVLAGEVACASATQVTSLPHVMLMSTGKNADHAPSIGTAALR